MAQPAQILLRHHPRITPNLNPIPINNLNL